MVVKFDTNGMNIVCNNNMTIRGADKLPQKRVNELQQAADGIANYAKSKKSKVVFSPAEYANEYIGVTTTGKTGCAHGYISMAENGEKPFLRNVYENLQLFLEDKRPLIEDVKSETLKKLRKIGKIK